MTWQTLRRGLALSPEMYQGLAVTLVLAVGMTAGRAAVPVAIQRAIDHGLRAPGGPDLSVVAGISAITAAVLLVSIFCGYLMLRRLFTISESALAAVRVKVFRHVHELSLAQLQSHPRGALVSRATGDVDQITGFLQWNGVVLLICIGQTTVTAAVMLAYSWQLALVVFVVFAPVVWLVRACMRALTEAYGEVRARSATMLGIISESVAGAEVIRAYNVSARTAARLDRAVEAHVRAGRRAARLTVTAFTVGELASGAALAATVVVGVLLGAAGEMTVGEITAFLFLVALFAWPAQVASEMLNGLQNAIAGWKRVLDVLDIEPAVKEPADGVELPVGPIDVLVRSVSFAYAGSESEALKDVDLDIVAGSRVAIVGETGAGKTTLAKLLTRLAEPVSGEILLSGVAIGQVARESLRERVTLVPQDGFLFRGTLADNIRFGRTMADDEVAAVMAELGLTDWITGLPDGFDTGIGERGEGLSGGERQLVALARAHATGADLLILDEATSAVDPATELRLRRALETVSRKRTTIAIAHRLATARDADEVIVVDAGRVVQRGTHEELVAATGSPYAKLHAAWLVNEQVH